MAKRQLKIGILSDSPFLVTGYSTISKVIANKLVEAGHDVYYLAHTYIGQNLQPGIKFEDGYELKFKIFGQGKEYYFKDLLEAYCKMYKFDVLFILLDTFMLYPWILNLDFSPAKTIFYYPSDGGSGMPLGCDAVLRKVNLPVAMAKFGQRQVKRMYNFMTEYIPHATNTKVFYPLSDEERNKLKAKWGLNGKFVIGTVARNQGRKMMDRTIKIMANYAKLNPNAIMLIHSDPDDAAQVFPIRSLIQRYGIENRVVFTGMKYFKGFDYSQMNEVYNLFDVFILSTSGEGFGIPIIEAMSSGIPVLCTDYTTTRELVIDNKAGMGIDLVGVDNKNNPEVHCDEILDGTITGSWCVERGLCSVDDGVKKLDYLFKNEKERKEMGNNGREAVLRDYDWDKVGKKWIETIERLGYEY